MNQGSFAGPDNEKPDLGRLGQMFPESISPLDFTEPFAPPPEPGLETRLLRAQNLPCFAVEEAIVSGPHHETWQLQLADPFNHRALELRISVLVSRNGFRRIAETWAVLFQRNTSNREIAKTALRQTYDLNQLEVKPSVHDPKAAGWLSLGPCELSDAHARGSIQSKGQRLEWDLRMAERQPGLIEMRPTLGGSLKARVPQPDLVVTGSCTLNGRKLDWTDSLGMQSHDHGTRIPQSGIRAHCNTFVNERGVQVPFVFEGSCYRGHVTGAFSGPRFTSLHFMHDGKLYEFNSLRDAIHLRSKLTADRWTFQAERGDLLFRGFARIDQKDFAGLTLENTDGSLVYCADSRLSDLEIEVFRSGKLVSGLRSDQTASLEVISRKRNPYIRTLV